MFHTPRKALCSVLATAAALGATAAPDALAQPLDAHTPDARDASASARVVQDMRSPDARGAAERSPSIAAGPPTWPVNPQPITRPRAVLDTPASGLDWGSAGIGAAAAAGAFAMAVAGVVGLRRRRFGRLGLAGQDR
jgi:hypothetical protein